MQSARFYFTGLVLMLFSTLVSAQPAGERAIVGFAPEAIGRSWVSEVQAIPIADATPFLSFFVIWEGIDDGLEVRFSRDGSHWKEWQPIHRDAHNTEKRISELLILEKEERFFQLSVSFLAPAFTSIECHFFNPGASGRPMANGSAQVESRACPCVQPTYLTRTEWCPDGNCPPNPDPSNTVVKHLIVHHSAGGNTSNDWPAVVRSIWDYHVNGNGWADIGYNWLIAPTGQVFEGRGDNILGAHFCGTNSFTMGVCMMGTYTNVMPTTEALTSLRSLLAWKACDAGILPLDSAYHSPSSRVLNRISGHRDGCSTECPGQMLYDYLPSLRQEVSQLITDNCAALAAPTQLTAIATGATTVDLEWVDNSDNETGFALERADLETGEFFPLTTRPANTTTFTDQGLTPEQTYLYRLRAVVGQDTSGFSNEVTVVTLATGVEDPYLNAQTVKITPNPTAASATLEIANELHGPLDITVLNAAGARVFALGGLSKETHTGRYELDLTRLTAGVYWINLRLASHTGQFRIIKQ